ncbi:hypothetical protein BOO69_04035 [Sulfitobacter alexandrii]|uniref:Methyltransferase type 11 domain-containing protein n=2 Tax=Sulfitobacter alexandrii TaxID=1917485 RepID=A0A1J0WEE7_9RHOB|nr:hypothetical protein BOO69_04035 [Sulfitobacter alexandrii]
MIEGRTFLGTWPRRLSGLFDVGVSFADQRILDVGCNMGIVGYEVCKQGPAYYHGVELLETHCQIARSIFTAVPVESVFHDFDVTDASVRNEVLSEDYDVVLYLAVHHHLVKKRGKAPAEETARDLFRRCRRSLIFRGDDFDAFAELADAAGFEQGPVIKDPLLHPFCAYTRRP